MSIESEKAHSFVEHLYSNAALQHYTPLQRESQIEQFLAQNAHTLLPTLSSPQFFPGYNWDKIIQLLFGLVRERTDQLFMGDIRDLLSHRINFDFLKAYDVSSVNYDQVEEQILTVIRKVLAYPRARQVLSGSHAAVLYDAFSRYLRISFPRRQYVHFELTKVQRLQISVGYLVELIKVLLLLMPIVWVFAEQELPDSAINMTANNLPDDVLARALNYLTQEVTLLPADILQSAIYANVSFVEDKEIDATSRIAAIFSMRCRNYHPAIKVDRGAESADKSWFYTAKRNYKFYGFDANMLKEFYSIASEEKW